MESEPPPMQPEPTATPTVPIAQPVDAGRGHPLGPLAWTTPLDSRIGGRIYATGVLVAVIAVFVVAWRLHPNGHMEGTHQQLGLPPCGFILVTGLPCPTCGMTTAFAYAAHGHLLSAMHAQSMGLLLALATAVTGLLAAWTLATGRRPALNWYRISPTRVVWIICGLFVAAWGVKIALYLTQRTASGGFGR